MMRWSATILGTIFGIVLVAGCADKNKAPVSQSLDDSNLPLADLVPEESNPSTLSAASESEPFSSYSSSGYRPGGLVAPPPGAPSGSGQVHTILRGQTLYSLAVKYYSDGQQWPRILEANAERISEPTKIPVGTKLIIP